jgi:transglutaminase-like putative cysteine protease
VAQEWVSSPHVGFHDYRDSFDNACRRLTLPEGKFTIRYDATVAVPDTPDDINLDARECPPAELPDEVLAFILPSRYCLSDEMEPVALDLFGNLSPGYRRVQAICDFVHAHLKFDYAATTPLSTALSAYSSESGVCRDFAHLAITFCRALDLPARYACGYIPDIGPPDPATEPMDFCAWFEVWLDGRWWVFDARNNKPKVGRTLICRGRDALDCAMITTYGKVTLEAMSVWAQDVTTHSR